MTLEQASNELLKALSMVIIMMGAYVLKVVIVYLHQKLDENPKIQELQKNAIVRQMAQTVVRYLEQVKKNGLIDATAAKEQALAMLQSKAEASGYSIDFEEADHLIEEAVNLMNTQFSTVVIPQVQEVLDVQE